MSKERFSNQEIARYAELFLLAHRQLVSIQRQLGGGMGLWQRWRFRSRHHRIQRLLRALLAYKDDVREEAEKSIERDLETMSSGKKGWSYVSTGQIEYLLNLLKGA